MPAKQLCSSERGDGLPLLEKRIETQREIDSTSARRTSVKRVRAAEAQYPKAFARPAEHAHRLDCGHARGIVRPDTAVYQQRAIRESVRREISRCGGCGKRYVHCLLLMVNFEALMVGVGARWKLTI